MVPAKKAEDYILIRPKALDGKDCRPARIVKCPFGPLVMWGGRGKTKCTFCGGEGDLLITGKDGACEYVDCPVCEGAGTDVEYNQEPIWSDADGNIVEPDITYHDAVNFTVSELWIAEWVKQKQGGLL
jgi:hypothetical protein